MYEHFRNEFAANLGAFTAPQIGTILHALDEIAKNYEIRQKSTALVVRSDPVPELVKTYLVAKKIEGLSDATLYGYARHLQLFFARIDKQPQEIEPNDVRLYLYRYQQARKISDRSLDKVRQAICGFYRWCTDEDYLDKNPCRTIPKIKYEIKPRQALTPYELEKVRRACRTKRETAMIEFLYSTGCRVSELTQVKKADIDFRTKKVHLYGKGKKHRDSFLNAKAEIALREYFADRSDDSEFVFVAHRRPYRALKKEAVEKVVRGIASRTDGLEKRLTPHVMRHTTATIGIHNGMRPESLQIMLGHEQINTTMIYAQADLAQTQQEFERYIT